MPTPVVARVDVGDVHLHERAAGELERVTDRVAVVRPGACVDDEAGGRLTELLAPLDVLALAVRLTADDVAAELRSPGPDPILQLMQREPAVDGRVAPLEDVEVGTVEHADEHPASLTWSK